MKSGWTLLDFTGEIHQISGWNLVDFMKSLVIAPTLHSSNWRVFAETLAFIILGGFHRSNLGEIHQISWVKSTRFQGEIHQISRVKSPTLHSSNWRVFAETLAFIILGGFHRWYLGEIHWISLEIHQISWISWNPPDFMVKSARFQGKIHMKSARFHEIHMKSIWNLPDFMKSTGFHEIHMKSARLHEICMKSAGFHGMWTFVWWSSIGLLTFERPIRRVFAETSASDFWNIWFHLKSAGFHEICQISWWNPLDFMDFMKSAGFHGEICWISWILWWNPPDFMVKSAGFHGEICQISWNLPDFMNVSFWVMIKYRSFYRKTNHRVTIPCKRSFDFTWNLPDFMKSAWNLVDFRWNPPQTL